MHAATSTSLPCIRRSPATTQPRRIPYTGPARTPTRRASSRPDPRRGDQLGVNLGTHYGDVVRLCGGFSLRCEAAGVELDDLVQAVAEAVLKSNRGPHPFDPARASLSRYLTMVASSRLSHMVDARRRRATHEELGLEMDAAAA